MTTAHKKLPFAEMFTRSRHSSGRADTEWESIMVQITLAFVIILGYLVSKGISESQSLAAETALQRKQNVLLERIVADFSNTDLGRERSQRIAAQQESQRQLLINHWLMLRPKRLFWQRVQQYRDAENVTLSDDLRALPVESSFNDLNVEIARIFLSDKGEVSVDEVQKLVSEVLTTAGFDLDAPYDGFYSPTPENLKILTSQIVGDLTAERSDLVQIQCALVEKIAAARITRLLTLPLGSDGDTTIDVNAPDLGRAMLERILYDLRADVQLLPEAEAFIRGTSNATPTTDQ